MQDRKRYLWIWVVFLASAGYANAAWSHQQLTIPRVSEAGPLRQITVDDIASLRSVDSLSVSPDGHRFAIFVKQGDATTNEYRTGWFVGSAGSDALTYVGDGGVVEPAVRQTGHVVGEVVGGEGRWSPDGKWIAYTLQRNGEVQLWRSRTDGRAQEQITHSASDVRDFAWSADGGSMYFTIGTPRAAQRTRDEERSRTGYRYDDDLWSFNDLMGSSLPHPLEANLSVWVVRLDDHAERLADSDERQALNRIQEHSAAGIERSDSFKHDAPVLPVARTDGSIVWLRRTLPLSHIMQVMSSASPTGANPIACVANECTGRILRVWWSNSGDRVLIWRREGINDRGNGFYSWSPATGLATRVLRTRDDDLANCSQAKGDLLICVRETPTRPPHIASVNVQTGELNVVADVNAEFRNIRLGTVERFEWDTPKLSWNGPGGALAGLYPDKAYGYILYPPNFDARKQYPVFIDPYVANGFHRPGSEHPLHVYAASGFVVLNTEFPNNTAELAARLGAAANRMLYSADLDFPHMTMLMESTVRGLDTAVARGFVDEHRIGIGGVSHGTFVPLYMVQKYDRLAAVSISSSTWGPHEYYWGTRRGRKSIADAFGKVGYEDWQMKPEGKGREFWSRIDIADHIDTIESPILVQVPDRETYGLLRLLRHLSDAGKPYDAYVFRDETHIKWQPAHLSVIMNRNLDWFRFWLQLYEDPNPTKTEQYSRWRELRARRDIDLSHAEPEKGKHSLEHTFER